MRMKIVFLVGFFALASNVQADTKPWAATQKLEDITGLHLPENYKDLAPWQNTFYVADEELPEYYDWRVYAQGLTPVKRQRAGDCWAQGTVGVLESLVKIWHGIEIDASVQQVISCSGSGTARNGGYFAHEYHRKVGAVMTSEYAYTASDTRCKSGLNPTYKLEKWGYVGQSNRSPTVIEMKKAMMEHGPLGVTISANSALQNFRGSGVFNGCTNGQTNHIEVIVGWNDKEGPKGVWYVRNSWGATHGDNGYAKIPFGCSRVGQMTTWADLKL